MARAKDGGEDVRLNDVLGTLKTSLIPNCCTDEIVEAITGTKVKERAEGIKSTITVIKQLRRLNLDRS